MYISPAIAMQFRLFTPSSKTLDPPLDYTVPEVLSPHSQQAKA